MRWPTGWARPAVNASRDARLAARVRAIYSRLDCRLAAFRRHSGLACLPGCGECCRSTEVEATVLELLPLALELCRRRAAEEVLGRLHSSRAQAPCILLSERPLGRFAGHCTEYSRRPLLCRLFGFSAMEDREGIPELVACRLIRQAYPARAGKAAAAMAQGRLVVPIMRAYTTAMYRLEPSLATGALPINAALRQALERVALAARLSGRSLTLQTAAPGSR